MQCRMMMYKVKSALEEGMDDDDSKAMAKTRELMLEEEVKLLETDLRMLREYIDSDRCIDENGKEHIAVKETAFTDLNCQACTTHSRHQAAHLMQDTMFAAPMHHNLLSYVHLQPRRAFIRCGSIAQVA